MGKEILKRELDRMFDSEEPEDKMLNNLPLHSCNVITDKNNPDNILLKNLSETEGKFYAVSYTLDRLNWIKIDGYLKGSREHIYNTGIFLHAGYPDYLWSIKEPELISLHSKKEA
jgi:hypothetical protein